jgi:GT2 family glycosyltransferase
VTGQGVIRISALESQDPEIRELLQRYRTIPHLEFARDVGDLHSLNGANIALRREVFDRIGGFDERLGPGASGTSEDVELAQRVRGAGMKIGYMREAIVYHRIDPSRLTEGYFKAIHKRQGASRLLFKQQSSGQILFDLCRVSAQYSFYSIIGNVRDRYRNKGRIYHYLGMLESKLNWKSHD